MLHATCHVKTTKRGFCSVRTYAIWKPYKADPVVYVPYKPHVMEKKQVHELARFHAILESKIIIPKCKDKCNIKTKW